MSDIKWEEVQGLDRIDILDEMETLAADASERAEGQIYGPSESYSWGRYAEAIRAAIRKLKESNEVP